MKKIHLVCNAHLDPVWLWEWEEGAAEALSTFRIAADFCEHDDGFVFNHNEVILYQWIEEYQPQLFTRIQRLVREGKWHIMGGWYLQPDCNMPAGESFVRHALVGRHYFRDKFGAVPTTAINFDSFGHSRGLVQILKKSGYDSYVICRPDRNAYDMKSPDFIWTGFDGSEIMVHRSDENYNSVRGQVGKELEQWLSETSLGATSLYLWGIGNHGGGPSRDDLDAITELRSRVNEELDIIHSVPETYFQELKPASDHLPKYHQSLNPVAQGCYTSQIRIKQLHRRLENDFYVAEKMASSAALQGRMQYPKGEFDESLRALMTAQFHDALPGSSIAPVESATLNLLGHGLELTSRLKARAFFALADGQEPVRDGETPVLVYNPHPFVVKGIFECEFVLPSQNWADEFSYPVMYHEGRQIPCQAEQEYSNFKMDWRKHAVFYAELQPSQMNRFDVKFERLPQKPLPELKIKEGKIEFANGKMEVEINCNTGLVDKYRVGPQDFLKANAFRCIVVEDTYNSWGQFRSYRDVCGEFTKMSKEAGSNFSGLSGKHLESVRIIEDGAVRVVVEAVFAYGNSFICQQYKLPKHGTELEVSVHVFWSEKDKMLKLCVPTELAHAEYLGQTAFGTDVLPDNGEEVVSQKWSAIASTETGNALTCVNDGIYGSDVLDGEMRLTLLRSASYATTDFLGRVGIPQDRFTARMDQGERHFTFWINAGTVDERLRAIHGEALIHNERPYLLSYCPPGTGTKPAAFVTLKDETIQLVTVKKAEKTDDYIIRLFEPTGTGRTTTLCLPAFGIQQDVSFKGFEIKTMLLKVDGQKLMDIDLMEMDLTLA